VNKALAVVAPRIDDFFPGGCGIQLAQRIGKSCKLLKRVKKVEVNFLLQVGEVFSLSCDQVAIWNR